MPGSCWTEEQRAKYYKDRNYTRRQRQAAQEIEETLVLIDYLLYYNLNFDEPSNFNRIAIARALEWNKLK